MAALRSLAGNRPRVVATLLACGGLGLAAVCWSWLGGGPRSSESTAEGADLEGPKTHVVLSPARREVAHLRLESCELRSIPDVRFVPGRVTYDATHHVRVRAPVDGVVREIRVLPGHSVAAGDVIAVVSSASVGTARADVLQREAEAARALRQSRWESEVSTNVEDLVDGLADHPDAAEIEKKFEKKVLGDYRERVLSAYLKYSLAQALDRQLKPLADQGIAEGRVARERVSNRQLTEAAYRAACEQAVFEARRKREATRADAEDAQRRLLIARSHVATLVGRDEERTATEPSALSLLEVRAPIGGTIEESFVAPAGRVDAGDSMFVVADTSRLWITADVREKNWQAIDLEPGTALHVQVPGIANRTFEARVHYVGRTVNEISHALPLVALIGNSDRALRPGMSCRVAIPLGASRHEVLSVPTGAVLEHEGKRFVFVEEPAGSFRRTDVQTGLQTEEWTEIQKGLKAGDKVVAEGAFVLKSELLLEAEE